MIHRRLTLFAVLIFVLTLLPASSYANEAGVGGSTGTGQVNNTMNMHGHDMSGQTMETPGSSITGQEPSAVPEQANPQSNDTTDTTSAGDMSDQNMNGTGHDMPADMPEHNMNMPDHGSGAVQDSNDNQAAGHGGSTTGLNPSVKEVNRAGLLGGFGLVDGIIVLAAVILKRKTKVGGAA